VREWSCLALERRSDGVWGEHSTREETSVRGMDVERRHEGHGRLRTGIGINTVRRADRCQDLEEVEEWNEYGEIKDNFSFSTQAPSTSNTPSKPPPTASEPTASTTSPSKLSTEMQPSPSSPSQPPTPATPSSTSADSPITAQMRQLGIEAARKASGSKTKPRTSAPEPSDISSEMLQKLDNAGPTGMPPPSGTTEAEAAKAPEAADANVTSKADERLTVEEFIEEESKEGGGEETVKGKHAEIEHSHGTLEPAVAAVGQREDKGKREGNTKALEEHGGLKARTVHPKPTAKGTGIEDEEETDEELGENTANAVTISADTTPGLPGKKTQDQGAGNGEEAGVSVGD
jgi:hypothetical protein